MGFNKINHEIPKKMRVARLWILECSQEDGGDLSRISSTSVDVEFKSGGFLSEGLFALSLS